MIRERKWRETFDDSLKLRTNRLKNSRRRRIDFKNSKRRMAGCIHQENAILSEQNIVTTIIALLVVIKRIFSICYNGKYTQEEVKIMLSSGYSSSTL